jgi:predicted nucleotidyltransferase
MNIPLFVTIIGSHMWGMSHEFSDVDLFVAYVESTNKLLAGASIESSETKYPKVDITSHELGKVVFQLTKGNYNYVTGLLSPCVVVTSSLHDELKEIFLYHLEETPGIIYESIHGMAKLNYQKYVASGVDNSPGRIKKIARSLFYGINIMDNPQEATLFNIKEMTAFKEDTTIQGRIEPEKADLVSLMKRFDDRYKKLGPEKKVMDTENIMNWLVQTRKNILIAESEKDVWRKLRA